MANREQARRHAKEKKQSGRPSASKGYPSGRLSGQSSGQLSPDALKLKLYETEREKKLIHQIVHKLNVVTLMVAHDKLYFGKKRLTRFYNFLLEEWDSVEKKYVSVEDMERALIEEVGIEFFHATET